jgi:tetratricopeptide (TPR) repeat protein
MARKDRRREEKRARRAGRPAGASEAAAVPGDILEMQRRATELYGSGMLRQAFRVCRRLVAAQPDRADVSAFAGMVALELGENAEAAELYGRATALKPDFAEAHYNLGDASRKLRTFDAAADAFRRAIEIKPDLAPAHNELGNVLMSLGAHGEAAESYEKAVALAPNEAEPHRNLGLALVKLERLDEAAEAFRRAIRIKPDWHTTYDNLATALVNLGDPGGAVEACDAWLELVPGSVEALAMKVIALNELGERDRLDYLLDFERFVRAQHIEAPPEYASLAAFNEALVRHVLDHPTLAVPPEDHPTYHNPQLQITDNLLTGNKGPMAHLETRMNEAVESYLAAVPRDPTHPFLIDPPRRWHLVSWGAVLPGEGNLEPHTHLDGYFSGVYYPQLPDIISAPGEDHAGWLELGRPPAELRCRAAPTTFVVQPEEGKMVLFPSYFHHATLPYEAPTWRVSIAFDVIPERPRS